MLRLCAVCIAMVACFAAGACSAPDPAVVKQDAVRRGDELLQQQMYPEAIAAYAAAVRVDPNDGELRLKLSRAHRGAKQWAEATREAILAADLLPGNRAAELQAIEALNNRGRFVEAAHRVTALLEDDPRNAEFLVLLANAKARLPTATVALSELQEALRLGLDLEQARLELRPPVSQSDDRAAENAYRQAHAIAPAAYNARLGLAGFLWATGRMDEGSVFLKEAADAAPEHAFLSRALGLWYAARGQDADALKYLKVAASSDDRVSQLVLADFLMPRARGEEALPMLDRIAAGNDPGFAAALRAAEIELWLDRRTQAMARAERVLARAPGNPRALSIQAQVRLAAGDFNEAARLARLALAGEPQSREARTVLARSLAATGKPEGAFEEFFAVWRSDPRNGGIARDLATLALALDRNDEAVEFARQSTRLGPDDRGASIVLAQALVRVGDFAAAEQTLAPFVASEPGAPDVLSLHAAVQAGRGNPAAARATYLRALQAHPDALETLSGLLALDIASRQTVWIRQRIDQTVARHPRDPRYLLLAARAADADGDAARAESILRAALEIDPAHVDAVLQLAGLLSRQNRRDDARRAIEQALASRPASLPLESALAIMLEESGRVAEARARYEKIIASNPGAHSTAVRLAALYANQGERLDVALELTVQARQYLPNDPAVGDTLGWVFVRKGLPALGLPHLLAAVKAAPANPLFHYHLGVAHLQQGELGKARQTLTRALALDPDFPGAVDARAALKTLGK